MQGAAGSPLELPVAKPRRTWRQGTRAPTSSRAAAAEGVDAGEDVAEVAAGDGFGKPGATGVRADEDEGSGDTEDFVGIVRLGGNEMKKSIQAEDQKDQTQKCNSNTGVIERKVGALHLLGRAKEIFQNRSGKLALAQSVDYEKFSGQSERLPVRVEACNNRAFSKL